VRTNLDLPAVRAAISAEPWTSVAIAFVTGACLAVVQPRGRLARAIASTAGAIALAAVREAARERVAVEARSWIDARFPACSRPAAT
jgi:hypothetical protein